MKAKTLPVQILLSVGLIILFFSGSFVLLTVINNVEGYGRHSIGLKPSQKFKIIKPIFIIGAYDDSANKTLTRDTAKAHLYSTKVAWRYYTAFQDVVVADTVMTIVERSSKPWYMYFTEDKYIVRLEPDISRGLDVQLSIGGGLEGNMDGLNPEIFSRM